MRESFSADIRVASHPITSVLRRSQPSRRTGSNPHLQPPTNCITSVGWAPSALSPPHCFLHCSFTAAASCKTPPCSRSKFAGGNLSCVFPQLGDFLQKSFINLFEFPGFREHNCGLVYHWSAFFIGSCCEFGEFWWRVASRFVRFVGSVWEVLRGKRGGFWCEGLFLEGERERWRPR